MQTEPHLDKAQRAVVVTAHLADGRTVLLRGTTTGIGTAPGTPPRLSLEMDNVDLVYGPEGTTLL